MKISYSDEIMYRKLEKLVNEYETDPKVNISQAAENIKELQSYYPDVDKFKELGERLDAAKRKYNAASYDSEDYTY